MYLFPLSYFAFYLMSFFPEKVELIFSQGIYQFIIRFLNFLNSNISISLGEITFIIAVICLVLFICHFINIIIKNKNNLGHILLLLFKRGMRFLGLVYIVFMLVWGLNYHRLPFHELRGLDVKPSSIDELEELNIYLINQANNLRENIFEDPSGVMMIEGGYKNVFERSHMGFEILGMEMPIFKSKKASPKPILLSRLLSYTGITGIYFPFTGEANVNIDIPHPTLPSTTCHEIAHQYGFAREDEANYISYLASTLHPDMDFQYSGTLLALIHSMNAMYRYDRDKYFSLSELYSEKLKRDLNAINEYWRQFEGPVERTSTKINNFYLKSNLQKDGVHSYGRMVDLLLAEFRKKH